MKNYYDILGVNTNAKDNEIKLAYKKLANKFHPDKNIGNKESEEKFKEINEAYATLSSPEKREMYDQKIKYGEENSSYDSYDWNFEEETNENKEKKYHINMEITLEECQFGSKRILNVPVTIICNLCNGYKVNITKTYKCFKCNGSGYEIEGDGYFMFKRICNFCNGSGYYSKENCQKCKGIGKLNINEKVNIDIPKYIKNGEKIVLRNINNFNGKIIVNVHIIKHLNFVRNGNDLHIKKKIFFINFLTWNSFTVKTLSGKELRIKMPDNKNFRKLIVNNMGLKTRYGENGKLYVHILVYYPLFLNDKQKKLLTELNKTFN
ncbi:DnaJ domain-containing protein [Candidatus Vidania fulgoroideorum]